MKKSVLGLLVVVLASALSVQAFAAGAGDAEQEFPTKGITAICPWSAGGGTDTILRALAKETEKYLGETITVTNETGGGGAVGHSAIMQAKPDGYTVGMITFELNSLPPQGLIPFDYTAYDPLMRINADAAALTVNASAPYNTLKEFIDYCKAHPGEVSIGNSGPGSVWHIAAGLMAQETGISVNYVPFDGAAPAVTALVGNHLQAVSVSVAEVRGQVQAGQLKILGIMGDDRNDLFPDVPTFKEQGVDVSFYTWRGMALPKGVPADVKAKLSEAFKEAFDSEEFKVFAKNASLTLAYQDADGFEAFLAQNYKDVSAVMAGLGLTK